MNKFQFCSFVRNILGFLHIFIKHKCMLHLSRFVHIFDSSGLRLTLLVNLMAKDIYIYALCKREIAHTGVVMLLYVVS